MKQILITGGAGYLGSVLIKKLVKKNYKVINLDPFLYSNIQTFNKKNRVINYIGLTEDSYILEKIFKKHKDIYAVVHLSGVSNDPTAMLNTALTKKANIFATEKIVKLAKKNKVKKFLFASSCSVYGFTGEKKLVDESSKKNPISEYAKSKVIGEKIVMKLNDDNFNVFCLRKGTLYGPSERMRYDLVLNTMVGSAIQDKVITINGGNQWRPFLHVDDAAEAYIKLIDLKNSKINGKILNIGSNDQNFQIKRLARVIKNKIPNCKIQNSKNFDNRSYKVNFDELKRLLKWSPPKKIEDGVNDTKKLFTKKYIKNYKDINYYNIKRLILHLNIS